MTVRFRIIASGSNGNAAYLSTKDGTLIIDPGISRKRIVNALEEDNIRLDEVVGILISHPHTDHCNGLPVLSDSVDAPLYITKGTKMGLESYCKRDKRWKEANEYSYILSFGEEFETNTFSILPLKTLHDTKESSGFQIIYNDQKFTFITDTGEFLPNHVKAVKDSTMALIEMNHDLEALETSRRPFWLKKRVKESHVENNQTIDLLTNVLNSETLKSVFVGHLSGECNSPSLVEHSISYWATKYQRKDIPWNFYICKRDETGKQFELSNDKIKTEMKHFIPNVEFAKKKDPKKRNLTNYLRVKNEKLKNK